jgi:uncharacterized coiled-coil protein SlyX
VERKGPKEKDREMADTNGGLTLKGLARILRDHIEATGARFAEVGARMDDLRREVAGVAGMIRDLSGVVLRQADEIAEHRRQIQQIYSRMEQHDARFEAMSRDIRRILDAMERRGGDGGARP